MKLATAKFVSYFCDRAKSRPADDRPATRDQLRAVAREMADTLEVIVQQVQPKSGAARDEALAAVDDLRSHVSELLRPTE